MAMTDLSFIFLILPVLTAASIFIKGRGRDILLSLVSLVFVLTCDFESARLLLVPAFDLCAVFILRRLNLEENKVKGFLTFLIVKSFAVLLLMEFFTTPATPIGAGLLFFDMMALSYFRLSGRSLNELDFVTYVLFFPKLFAGPHLSPKVYLRNKAKEHSLSMCAEGISLFIWGAGKEIILVKQLDGIISNIFYHYESSPSVFFAWSLAFLCAMKVYLYLSAFGDMGRGIGKIFMIDMPKGAFFPFFSPSIKEFIKRMGLSLSETLGSAFSVWGISLKKKQRSYLSSFSAVFYINMLLRHLGMSWGFCIYFGFLLLLDYFFLSKVKEKSQFISALLVMVLVLPAFIFILPMDGAASFKFLIDMFMVNGLPLFAPTTIYFSAANIASVVISFVISTGLIYAGGSFAKKMAPNAFKFIAVFIIAAIMVLIASFNLLEGGI